LPKLDQPQAHRDEAISNQDPLDSRQHWWDYPII
jgi:hypothetical protein